MSQLNKEKIRLLLSQRFKDDERKSLSELPSPFSFKDMQKAVDRIKDAIKKRQKITIVGDYDVDGVVSSVIVSEFFDDLGVEYDLIIPNRFREDTGSTQSF